MAIATVPLLLSEASDRFDQMVELSKESSDSIYFANEIDKIRIILSKTNF